MNIDRKTTGLALLTVVLIAAVASGIFLTQASNASAATTNLQSNYNTQLAIATTPTLDATDTNSTNEGPPNMEPFWGGGMMEFGGRGRVFGRCGGFGLGPIEVSDEYKTAVTNIVENDTDVQTLLSQGYNVTRIMPIIKTVIDADGTLTTKATSATAILEKGTTGIAFVSVDLSQNKVTQIVTYTKTVIEK